MSDFKYFVIVNRAEHSGYVAKVDMDKIWNNQNPDGWTYQDLTGPYGQVWEECDTSSEADKVLGDYLKCDAAERGEYCYTHNPLARR